MAARVGILTWVTLPPAPWIQSLGGSTRISWPVLILNPGNIRTAPFGPYGVPVGLDCPDEAVVDKCSFQCCN